MHDDDFDPRLAQRLRAYESRLPDADAPEPATLGGRRRWVWPIFVTGGTAVVAGALLAVLLLNRPDTPVGEASPTPSASRSAVASIEPSTTPSVTPAASATPTQGPAPTEDGASQGFGWQAVASFGGDGGPSIVHDVAATGEQLVAVGVAYRQPLPNVGPTPPHRARVWTSADGASCSEV